MTRFTSSIILLDYKYRCSVVAGIIAAYFDYHVCWCDNHIIICFASE